MKIIIRDKHTREKKDFGELFELITDSITIYMVIESKDGWKKPYSLNMRDYEIAYIG